VGSRCWRLLVASHNVVTNQSAVSIALALRGEFSAWNVVMYIAAQIVGGTIGVLTAQAMSSFLCGKCR
jgi:glycerol uptake facilitator-like aquaporin